MLILSESPLRFHFYICSGVFQAVFCPFSSILVSLCRTDIYTHTHTFHNHHWCRMSPSVLLGAVNAEHDRLSWCIWKKPCGSHTNQIHFKWAKWLHKHSWSTPTKRKKNYAWDYVCIFSSRRAIRLKGFIHEPNQEQWCVPPWKPARALRDTTF